jgi:hypothetical protein
VGVPAKKNWRNKLHPVFFELAELNRWFELKFKRINEECKKRQEQLETSDQKAGQRIGSLYYSAVGKLSSKLDEKLIEINRRHPNPSYNSLAYSYFDLASNSPADNLIPYLHWMRHRESLRSTTDEDAKGSIKAWRKIARTAEDYRRIRHKKGAIKSFQGDTVHRQLLELMFCFELKPLTAEERADCVDAYCACGKTHDPDALKKQFGRLKRELQSSAKVAAQVDAQHLKP